jgi:DNA polymerase epsilon subunit 1
MEVEEFIRRSYAKEVISVVGVDKEDLDLVNHLSGATRRYMKISFLTVQALLSVRGKLMGKINKNRRRLGVDETYAEMGGGDDAAMTAGTVAADSAARQKDFTDYIYDIREYDVTYYQRFAVDKGVRVGMWYVASMEAGTIKLEKRSDLLDRARVKVMAFDIETTHAPMRFPDSEVDCITMMSFMLDQQGYLIVNRELVAEDIRDFEYTPKPEFVGPFKVFNEPDEASVLRRFYSMARSERPHIYVSFNGDTFDWPFIEARSKVWS